MSEEYHVGGAATKRQLLLSNFKKCSICLPYILALLLMLSFSLQCCHSLSLLWLQQYCRILIAKSDNEGLDSISLQ